MTRQVASSHTRQGLWRAPAPARECGGTSGLLREDHRALPQER